MRKRLMIYLLVMVAAYLMLALFLRWREPSMIYYPTRPIEQTPDRLGWNYEDVYLTAADGVKINGWFLPAPSPPTTNPPSRITIVFFHGNAGNISHRFEKLAALRELGADVFIIDYRGYGRSDDRQPNEPGTYRDAQAAYEYLTAGASVGRALPPRRLVVYGESLGSAVAVDLAAKHPVAAVIIEEPFTSVGDVGQSMFPFMPVRLLVRNKYDTLGKIARINAPLLIFHSRDDEIFPFHHGERLFAAAREPKQLIELRGGHNDAFLTSAATYRNGLKDFLARLRKP